MEGTLRRAALLGAGFAAVVAAAWAARGLAQPEAERALLLALNPEAAPALLDSAVILLTDFSLPTFAVVFTAWLLASELLRWELLPPSAVVRAMPVLGAGAGLVVSVALGGHYDVAGIPEVMVPVAALGFGAAGWSLRRPAAPGVARARRAYAATLVAVALALATEALLEELCAFRHRPLAAENAGWNAGLRALADEHVTSGTSYVSGHALSFFALVTPLAWMARSRAAAAVLLGWAALHAGTRLYVAAHFPLGVLVGSAAGLGFGALAALALRAAPGDGASAPPARPGEPARRPSYPALPEAP